MCFKSNVKHFFQPNLIRIMFRCTVPYLERSLWYAVQLVVGQDEVPQVHQTLKMGVIQGGEAVSIQVKGMEVLEVGEGVW